IVPSSAPFVHEVLRSKRSASRPLIPRPMLRRLIHSSLSRKRPSSTRWSPVFMKTQLDWLKKNHAQLIADLGKLVAIRGVSTDGEHQKEIGDTANLVCEQMRSAGLQK